MAKKARPNMRQHMLTVNVRQKDFYESRFEASERGMPAPERAANGATNVWTVLRRRLWAARKDSGIDVQLYHWHRTWLGDLTGRRVLDLGCFAGNYLSLDMAAQCAEYIGVDLSEQAIERLNAKLQARGLTHAHAYAQDFLAHSYPDNYFDVIYAFSVLHHFEDMGVLLAELARILKPGGMLISMDPLMTDPLNRLARLMYRPLQTDRAWEWPFTRRTFHLIHRHFVIADLQGIAGAAKIGLALQLMPGFEKIGRAVARWGQGFDRRHARRLGLALYWCWWITMQLRKPAADSGGEHGP